MAYRCRICGVSEVDNPGDICELCAIGQDPYSQGQATYGSSQFDSQSDSGDRNNSSHNSRKGTSRKVLLNGGKSLSNQDPYGNDMTVSESEHSVRVYSAGEVPQEVQHTENDYYDEEIPAKNQPITSGITKNISADVYKRPTMVKWFSALFMGIPFTLDDDVTTFQVFPDFSGTALNAMGNACDQVIVYGKLNSGVVSENNDVEVYGRRDSKNNVIAKEIKNKASGTTIRPERSIGQGAAWFITVVIIALVAAIAAGLGTEGVIWTVVVILCLTNLPTTLKVFAVIIGAVFSIFRRFF